MYILQNLALEEYHLDKIEHLTFRASKVPERIEVHVNHRLEGTIVYKNFNIRVGKIGRMLPIALFYKDEFISENRLDMRHNVYDLKRVSNNGDIEVVRRGHIVGYVRTVRAKGREGHYIRIINKFGQKKLLNVTELF